MSTEISIKTRIGMDYMDEWAPLLKYPKIPHEELIISPQTARKKDTGDFPSGSFSQRRWKPCNVL